LNLICARRNAGAAGGRRRQSDRIKRADVSPRRVLPPAVPSLKEQNPADRMAMSSPSVRAMLSAAPMRLQPGYESRGKLN
jgi:hypothetical protein